jgi:2-(1,2-epoxy-1,2-dihydrophenyl)acetyl-CoA isomerase
VPLRYAVEEGVGLITLDRPDVLNAFDDELGRETLDAVREASADAGIRCVVLTGAGRAFSSGQDLASLSGAYEPGRTPELGTILTERYNPIVLALRAAPKPVLAAVNGVAAGAGASFALACDLRIASESARLVLGFSRVGLIPDSGALWFLARAVGTATATRLALLDEPLSAAAAASLGLFDEVVPAEEFERRWRALAERLARGPTLAFALAKELLRDATDRPLEEQLRFEVDAQARAGRSADHKEGVRAFLEKRPARYSGR